MFFGRFRTRFWSCNGRQTKIDYFYGISYCKIKSLLSSAVERLAVNEKVQGSNPWEDANGELVNRYNVALSRQCDGFDSRTFRKVDKMCSNHREGTFHYTLQMSYNGYYSFLPSRRRRFDSSHLLKLSDGVIGSTIDFDSISFGSSPGPITKWELA